MGKDVAGKNAVCHGLRKGALLCSLYRSRGGLCLTAWQCSLHRPQSSRVNLKTLLCSAFVSLGSTDCGCPWRQEADKIQLWHMEVPVERMLSFKMPGYPKSSPEDLSLLNTGVWIPITLSWDLLSAVQPNTKEQWELSWTIFCAWRLQWLHLLCLQRSLKMSCTCKAQHHCRTAERKDTGTSCVQVHHI